MTFIESPGCSPLVMVEGGEGPAVYGPLSCPTACKPLYLGVRNEFFGEAETRIAQVGLMCIHIEIYFDSHNNMPSVERQYT